MWCQRREWMSWKHVADDVQGFTVCCVKKELWGTWGGSPLNHTHRMMSTLWEILVWLIEQIMLNADWKGVFGQKTWTPSHSSFSLSIVFHFAVLNFNLCQSCDVKVLGKNEVTMLRLLWSHFVETQLTFPCKHCGINSRHVDTSGFICPGFEVSESPASQIQSRLPDFH